MLSGVNISDLMSTLSSINLEYLEKESHSKVELIDHIQMLGLRLGGSPSPMKIVGVCCQD